MVMFNTPYISENDIPTLQKITFSYKSYISSD